MANVFKDIVSIKRKELPLALLMFTYFFLTPYPAEVSVVIHDADNHREY